MDRIIRQAILAALALSNKPLNLKELEQAMLPYLGTVKIRGDGIERNLIPLLEKKIVENVESGKAYGYVLLPWFTPPGG